MSVTLLALSILATAALLWSMLLTLQTYEHQRFARAALKASRRPWVRPPNVLVSIPCKGLDLELADNLRCVLSQEYPNFQVRFVVESEADPACEAIRSLMTTATVPCELIFAGASSDSGQKVHNLLAATSNLPDDVEVLAFFDSDARPAPQALSCLVDRIYRSNRLQVATGYRWFVPRRGNLASLALASANASLAGLMIQRGLNLVWGGTWAISRAMFEKTALADAWRGTLSDDLVASRVLRWAGVKLAFEPGCMVPSPIDVGWSDAFTFLRRQFLIVRCYSPLWWWSAIPLLILQLTVFFGGLLLGASWGLRGADSWYVPIGASAALYALASLRAHWRQALWCAKLDGPPTQMRAAARFDRWAAPATALLTTVAMLASAIGNRIIWRGIHYHIGAAGRITLLGRVPSAELRHSILAVQQQRWREDKAQLNSNVGGSLVLDRAASNQSASDRLTEEPPRPKRAA